MSLRKLLSGLAVALALSQSPARAGVPVPPSTEADPLAGEAMLDALTCVAAVMTFHTREGKEACTRLILAMPDEVLGHKFRGLAYLLEHDFVAAEADFRVGRRLDGGDPEIQAGFAQSLSGQGRYAEALPIFDEALLLAPDDIRFLAARCWARAGEGRNLDLALEDCNRALVLAPGFIAALQSRGVVRLKEGEYAAAIADYSEALAADPGMPSVLFGRGFAYLRLKDDAKGRADILAARRMDPGIDNLFIRLGVLPASCREPAGACPLPPDLHNRALSPPALAVSYSLASSAGFDELIDVTIPLGRMDVMLERTAALLHTSPGPGFSDRADEDEAGVIRHVLRIQREYRRQQRLACTMGTISGLLCRAPTFQPIATTRADSSALRLAIEQTMDAVYPFWTTICRRRAAGSRRCEIE